MASTSSLPILEGGDIVISFDTTGSMYPCIREVRRNIKTMVKRLYEEIPGIRIGIVAHGDYCDEKTKYLMKSQDLTTDQSKIIDFVSNVENTFGGDYPEAYEYVLHKVQEFSWESAKTRALIVIADAYPHGVNENPHKLDWRVEADKLKKMGVNIYGVQCLNNGSAKCHTFYSQIATLTNGYHLQMDQFSYVKDMIMAVCFRQVSNTHLEKYEQELDEHLGGMTPGMRRMFDIMLHRKLTELPKESKKNVSSSLLDEEDVDDSDIHPSPPAKFQILEVKEDCSIKQYVQEMGLIFKAGKGFYSFTKPEIISLKKQIVLMEKGTGRLYEGKAARKLAKIPMNDTKTRIKPTEIPDYDVYIQSTSYNRKLIGNTKFLYEVSDFDEVH